MTREKDKAAPERIWAMWPQMIYSLELISESHQIEYVRADLLATKVKEARQEAFKDAAGLASAMAAGETFETGRQKALNIAAALAAAAQGE